MQTNHKGGKQSEVPYRLEIAPAGAILKIGQILKTGAAMYGIDNWRLIPTTDHLNHALGHIFSYLAGNADDDHLANAATRLLFALELVLDAGRRPDVIPLGYDPLTGGDQ